MSDNTDNFIGLVDRGARVSTLLSAESGYVGFVVGYAIPVKGDWLMVSNLHPVYQQNWHDIVLMTFKMGSNGNGASYIDQYGRQSYITALDSYERQEKGQWSEWKESGRKWTQERFDEMIAGRLESPITFVGDADVS